MEADATITDFSWLAMTATNRSVDVFVLDHFWLALTLLAVGSGFLLFTRAILHPSLPQRSPRLAWCAEILIAPVLVMLAGSLMERSLFAIGALFPSLYVDLTTAIFFYLLLAWLIARGIELFFWQGYIEKRTGYTVPVLLRGLSYAVLLLLALILIMWRSGYSPTGVLISTGVVAAVVALALQNTLGDLFSGIALSLEQPYGIGDWIELDDGTLGQVIDISWRSTRLLSFNNSEFVVSNSRLARHRIHNYTQPELPYAQWYEIKLPPEIEPTTAKRMLTDAVTRCRHVMHNPPPTIRLADAGTVPYKYFVYVHFRNYLAMYPGRDAMFREIDAELRRQNLTPSTASQELYLSRRGPVHMQPATLASALRGVDLFAVLDQAQIDQLAGQATFEVVEADVEVMQQGQAVDAIYVVWSGLLRSHYLSAEGVRIEVEELQPGDSFGQIAVVTAEPALVTMVSATECIVIRIEPEALKPLIEQTPDLARSFAKVVADRLQSISRAQAARAASQVKALPTSVTEIRHRLEAVIFGDRAKRLSR